LEAANSQLPTPNPQPPTPNSQLPLRQRALQFVELLVDRGPPRLLGGDVGGELTLFRAQPEHLGAQVGGLAFRDRHDVGQLHPLLTVRAQG
jgi:hypothetical protein